MSDKIFIILSNMLLQGLKYIVINKLAIKIMEINIKDT